jgi:hypothetical protein
MYMYMWEAEYHTGAAPIAIIKLLVCVIIMTGWSIHANMPVTKGVEVGAWHQRCSTAHADLCSDHGARRIQELLPLSRSAQPAVEKWEFRL